MSDPIVASKAARKSRYITVEEHTRPILARHARLQFDQTRERWVILVPERVMAPDDIAVETIKLCDGIRDVGAIADEFAQQFSAPRDLILNDVLSMLNDLASRGFIIEAKE